MLSTIKQLRWILVLLVALPAINALGHGMSEAEKQVIIQGGNFQYMKIGVTHMLSGYDHLAFVFGIIFLLTHFKDVVKYVTTFTVGHSITLIFATFASITVNYFLVDAVIALSVCYIAFHNLEGFKKYLNIKAPNMLAMIFGLGLIHGLGLSTRLQQLPLSEDNLFLNIISFNVGVELGQISALAVMLLLISAVRKRRAFPTFGKIANSFLFLIGGFLFLIQMHGYDHAANAEELASIPQSVPPVSPLATVENTSQEDVIIVVLSAMRDKEYKLQLKKGATLEYAWETDKGDLFFDLHGEPTGDTTGYFKSFKKATSKQSNGTFTTSFDGPHGWYWNNKNSFPVSITLKVKGDYRRLDLDSESQK